jgi:hypothetical protein
MGRTVVLLSAAAVFVTSCGPQEVGKPQRESQSVDLENAQSAHAELRTPAPTS